VLSRGEPRAAPRGLASMALTAQLARGLQERPRQRVCYESASTYPETRLNQGIHRSGPQVTAPERPRDPARSGPTETGKYGNRMMRKAALSTLLLALAAPATLCSVILVSPRASFAAGPTAEEIGARVQQFYDSTKTFKANFEQTYTIKVQNVKKVSTGKVT